MNGPPAARRPPGGPLTGLTAGLFPHVGAAAADELAALADPRELRPDEVLYEQGDDRDPALHVVLGGLLLVEQRRPHGPEHLLAVLGPGDLAGEVGALDPGPRSTRVSALVASHVATVPRTGLAAWQTRHPSGTEWLLRAVAQRVRRAERDLADLSGLDSAARLAKVLLDLAGYGHREPDGVVIDGTLTQVHLGRLAGCSRETTNKTLRVFARTGLVALERRRLVVTDTTGLQRVASRAQRKRGPRRREAQHHEQ